MLVSVRYRVPRVLLQPDHSHAGELRTGCLEYSYSQIIAMLVSVRYRVPRVLLQPDHSHAGECYVQGALSTPTARS